MANAAIIDAQNMLAMCRSCFTTVVGNLPRRQGTMSVLEVCSVPILCISVSRVLGTPAPPPSRNTPPHTQLVGQEAIFGGYFPLYWVDTLASRTQKEWGCGDVRCLHMRPSSGSTWAMSYWGLSPIVFDWIDDLFQSPRTRDRDRNDKDDPVPTVRQFPPWAIIPVISAHDNRNFSRGRFLPRIIPSQKTSGTRPHGATYQTAESVTSSSVSSFPIDEAMRAIVPAPPATGARASSPKAGSGKQSSAPLPCLEGPSNSTACSKRDRTTLGLQLRGTG